MADIDTEDLRPHTRRSSNNDILLNILEDVQDHGKILAGMAPQITMLVDQGKQTQAQLHTMADRIESGDKALATVRIRMDALESRPLAMNPEERGELMRSHRETASLAASLKEQLRDQENLLKEIKALRPIFSEEEQKDMRYYLDLARRAQIQEVFLDPEVKDLKKMREAWVTEAGRRMTFTSALINHGTWIVAALIFGVLSFALTAVFTHLALQIH